ncbi:MAG TPA: hydrogenase maturation protease [Candidatus Cloacimonetes bacterium]|nr:hydrogenase maturation protease [Candidatus Cloacimonadota bacterium]
MKTLILGLGNTIRADDGVGIHIANKLKDLHPELDVIEASAAGFRIIDEIIGYDKLILIDSIQTGQKPVGSYYIFGMDEFQKTMHHTSPHDMSMFEAFEMMKEHDADLPGEVVIYAIEVKDTLTFSEECTPEVTVAIPKIADIIFRREFPPRQNLT